MLLTVVYVLYFIIFFFFHSFREHVKYLQIKCKKLIRVHKYSAHGVFVNDVIILHMLAIAFSRAGDLPQWLLLLFTVTYINIACVLTKLITVVMWKQMPCQWTPIPYFSNVTERIYLIDPKNVPFLHDTSIIINVIECLHIINFKQFENCSIRLVVQ